jgi:hypothetical protein
MATRWPWINQSPSQGLAGAAPSPSARVTSALHLHSPSASKSPTRDSASRGTTAAGKCQGRGSDCRVQCQLRGTCSTVLGNPTLVYAGYNPAHTSPVCSCVPLRAWFLRCYAVTIREMVTASITECFMSATTWIWSITVACAHCRDNFQGQCRNVDECPQINPCSPYSCPGYDSSANQCPVNWQDGQLYAQNQISSTNSLYSGCYIESCNRQCRCVLNLGDVTSGRLGQE